MENAVSTLCVVLLYRLAHYGLYTMPSSKEIVSEKEF
jgi:hypothetical protein